MKKKPKSTKVPWGKGNGKLLASSALALGLLGSSVSFAAVHNCDVAIVGAGPAGNYTAYKLSQDANIDASKLCLIERNGHIGGNFKDVPITQQAQTLANVPAGNISTGPYRMLDDQFTYELVLELGLGSKLSLANDLQTVKRYKVNGVDLAGAGELGVSIDDMTGDLTAQFQAAFPNLSLVPFLAFRDEVGHAELQLCRKVDGSGRQEIMPGERYDYRDADLGTSSFGQAKPDSFLVQMYSSVAALEGADPVTAMKAGQEARDFYANIVLRFRADNNYNLKPSAYLEFLSSEWWSFYTNYYLDGGMQQIQTTMHDKYMNKGGQTFLNSEVATITKFDGKYKIATLNGDVFLANKVILAADATGLNKIKGGIANQITKSDEFKAIIGDVGTDNSGAAKVFVVHHVWDTNWWDGKSDILAQNADGSTLNGYDPSGAPILRADTNDTESCNNIVEIAPTDYYNQRNITRTAYNDNLECYNKVKAAYDNAGGGAAGDAAVNAIILPGLSKLFPKVFDGNNDPQPVQTVVRFFPNAWISQVSEKKDVTVGQIWNWAQQPIKNEEVYLVGGAYANGFGWSNSAYISASKVLKEKFGIETLSTIPGNTNGVISLDGISCLDGSLNDFDVDYTPIYDRDRVYE